MRALFSVGAVGICLTFIGADAGKPAVIPAKIIESFGIILNGKAVLPAGRSLLRCWTRIWPTVDLFGHELIASGGITYDPQSAGIILKPIC